jgi:hypothetical protein
VEAIDATSHKHTRGNPAWIGLELPAAPGARIGGEITAPWAARCGRAGMRAARMRGSRVRMMIWISGWIEKFTNLNANNACFVTCHWSILTSTTTQHDRESKKMKIEFNGGWFKIRAVVGRKHEVTYRTRDGRVFCENILLDGWQDAANYCKRRI